MPLVLADDVEAAAKAGTLGELRLELTLQGLVQKDRLTLRVNRQPVTGGELVLLDAASRLTCSLAATQLKLGQNELEVSLRQDPQGASEPVELVKAQQWVKYQ